jgi:hypothetical protein
MTANKNIRVLTKTRIVSALEDRFAPFEKGGCGGFALALRAIREQEQIPLGPPFLKGETKLHRWVDSFPHVNESFMWVAA